MARLTTPAFCSYAWPAMLRAKLYERAHISLHEKEETYSGTSYDPYIPNAAIAGKKVVMTMSPTSVFRRAQRDKSAEEDKLLLYHD